MKRTHCKNGHEMTPENTYTRRPEGWTGCVTCRKTNSHLGWLKQKGVARNPNRRQAAVFRDPGQPGFVQNYNFPKIKFCSCGLAILDSNIRITKRSVRCRACCKLGQKKFIKAGNVGEQIIRRVLEELRAGKTMAAITGRRGGRYVGRRIIQNDRLDAFCNKNPKIGKLIRLLSAKNAIAQRASNRAIFIAASPVIIRSTGSIVDEIEAAVPRHLPRDLRDDAIQNIWMAVLEGRLKRSEIPSRAHEFVRAEYKTNHNAWGEHSLDLPIYIDSNTTLLDRLSTEAGTGYWDVNMMASTGRRK